MTVTFTFTGGEQSFPVPSNVCEVALDASGAQGGAGTTGDELDTDALAPEAGGDVGVAQETVGNLGGLGGRRPRRSRSRPRRPSRSS